VREPSVEGEGRKIGRGLWKGKKNGRAGEVLKRVVASGLGSKKH